MDNFFYKESDFELFKKALKISENEAVVINIMKDDESLRERNVDEAVKEKSPISQSVRKRSAFTEGSESPFSKYFSPRRKSNKPVDISNFSNWRNKNYRNIEKTLDEEESSGNDFSISDYFTERTRGKTYNHSDQVTTDTQKPLNELSVDDEKYKRFSLDSYLQKLERQTQVEDEFEKSGDLLEPLGSISQDENAETYDHSDTSFEDTTNFDFDEVINDDEDVGEKYSFDRSKLDTVKDTIEKKREQEESGIDETEDDFDDDEELEEDDDNFITFEGDEEKSEDDEEFDSDDELSVDESSENKTKHEDLDSADEADSGTGEENPSGEEKGKQDFDESETEQEEVVETETDTDQNETVKIDSDQEETSDSGEDFYVGEQGEQSATTQYIDETDQNIPYSPISQSGEDDTDESKTTITKQETDVDSDFAAKQKTASSNPNPYQDQNFGAISVNIDETHGYPYWQGDRNEQEHLTETSGETLKQTGDENPVQISGDQDENKVMIDSNEGTRIYEPDLDSNEQQDGEEQTSSQQDINSKLVDIIDQKEKTNLEMIKKLEDSENQKNIQKTQYEEQIKNLEDNMKQQKEESERLAHLDKLKFDENIKSLEETNKKREIEIREEERKTQELKQLAENLNRELRSNLESSNLEMDKKYYETALESQAKPSKPKTATGTRKKKKTRRFDSDIIGSIEVE